MGEVQQEVPLSGFDPEGEPVIRVLSDGGLSIVFDLMPPSWAESDPERFDNFDRQLAAAVGMEVEWEDRETFLIRQPRPDTLERVRRFIEGYRRE